MRKHTTKDDLQVLILLLPFPALGFTGMYYNAYFLGMLGVEHQGGLLAES